MKLAAIYNLWDGDELFQYSFDSIVAHVDLIIIVWQDISNFGERYHPICLPRQINQPVDRYKLQNGCEIIYQKYQPELQVLVGGSTNETRKRNIGLNIARKDDCTHFFFIDCDELYQNFAEAKQQFITSGANGSVCRLFTYWGKPSYQLTPIEEYWVPFIHKLKENTVAGMQEYPFWVDPTRRVNEQNVVEIPTMMHHFSYVRKDIERKIRNSSAKVNLERSTYLQDYKDLMAVDNADGHFLPGIKHTVKIVENIFNITISGQEPGSQTPAT